jgi:hypothetical protein
MTKRGLSASDIAILPLNFLLSTNKKPKKYLIFLTSRDFLRNLSTLQSKRYQHSASIIFANPLKLNEIVGVYPLDYEPSTEFSGFQFKLTALDIRPLKKMVDVGDVSRMPVNYLAKLIEHFCNGSLLNAFMTCIYSLPSGSQKAVKEACLKWLYLGKSEHKLSDFIESYGIQVTPRLYQRLTEILFTDTARTFREALKAHRTTKASLSKLAKEYDVSEYELSYIVSIAKANDKYSDSFDKAKNGKHR